MKPLTQPPNRAKDNKMKATASEEVKTMLMSMRDLYFEGKHQEGHQACIVFLSGLYTGLNLKEK